MTKQEMYQRVAEIGQIKDLWRRTEEYEKLQKEIKRGAAQGSPT